MAGWFQIFLSVAALMSSGTTAAKGCSQMSGIENARITIATTQNEFKSGDDIKLAISLKNSGTEPLTIVQRSHWLNHVLSVSDANGNQVPETPAAVAAKEGAEAGFRVKRQLMPGEELKEVFDLNKAFELKKPGVYKVRAQRHVSKTSTFEQPVLLDSNELVLRIVP